MKKFFVLVLILWASLSWAGDAVQYSGLTTTDILVTSKPCYLYGVNLISGGSTASVVIYDSNTATITSQVTVYKGNVGLSAGGRNDFFSNPIELFNGIYVDLTGTGAACVIYYKPK